MRGMGIGNTVSSVSSKFVGANAKRVVRHRSTKAAIILAAAAVMPMAHRALAGTFTTSATAPTGSNLQISQPDDSVNGGNISGYQDYTDNYSGAGQVFTPLSNFLMTSFTFQGAGSAGNISGNWTITVAAVNGNYYGGPITVIATETADSTPIATDVSAGNKSNYDTLTFDSAIPLTANQLYYWSVSSNNGRGYYGLAGTPKGPNNSSYVDNTTSDEYTGGESANLSDGLNGDPATPSIFQQQDADHTFFVSSLTTGTSQWSTNGNASWLNGNNWVGGVTPSTSSDTATFSTDGGTITTSPIVTLNYGISLSSIVFNTSSGGYTIANGGSGQITTNSVNVLSGTHEIDAGLVTKDGETFTVDTGASLTVTNLIDGVGYYHNVSVTGGGTLAVNNINNAALNIGGGTTFTILAGSAPTTGVYLGLGGSSTLNINSSFDVYQIYTDNGSTINIGPAGSFITEKQTASVDAIITGSGSIAFGGGSSGVPGTPSITANNSNYSGAVSVSNGATLVLGSQYFTSSDASLGNGSATNTVTLNNGTLMPLNASITGTHAFTIASGGGTFSTNSYNIGVGSVSGPGTLAITGGGIVTVAAEVAPTVPAIRSLTLGGLNISSGSVVVSSAALHTDRTLLTVGSLTLSGTNQLDLGSNDLDLQSATLSTIATEVKQAFAGGTWQGSGGITSSAAASDSKYLTALGVIVNSTTGVAGGAPLYGTGTTLGTFDGASPSSSDILVKYTYYGDTNLDGAVDGSDYTNIDNGFHNHLTGWQNGDFNYDNKIDGSDYTLIDNAFNTQGSTLGSNPAAFIASSTAQIGGGSAVPEPASLSLIGIATVGILARRRRH